MRPDRDDELPPGGDAVQSLIDGLRAVVERHVKEWDMPHASVVGALHLVAAEVVEDWLDGEEVDGDDEESSDLVEPDDPAGS